MIKIYHAGRSRALRVIWLMEELGEPYEVERISYPVSGALLAKNPQGTLPFIEDGDVAMAESLAILQYITGMRLTSRPQDGPSLTVGPRPSPAKYAEHLQMLHMGEASLTTPLTTVFATRLVAPEAEKDNATTKLCIDMFLRRLGIIDAKLGDRRTWVTGEEFTIADISIGYALFFAERLGIENQMPERVQAYYKRLKERLAYKRTMEKYGAPAA